MHKKNKERGRPWLSGSPFLLVLAVVAAFGLWYMHREPNVRELSYGSLMQICKADDPSVRFQNVLVRKSSEIRGTLVISDTISDGTSLQPQQTQEERAFRTRIGLASDPELLNRLDRRAGANYQGDEGQPLLEGLQAIFMGFLIFFPILLIGFIFMRWMAGGGGALTFGRSKHKLYAEKDLKTTFEDVAGIEEAVAELREIVDFLKTPEKYQALGGRIPKGVLLVGPPGTGKCVVGDTLIVTAKGMIEIQDIPKYFWVDPTTHETAGASLASFDLATLQTTHRLASHWYDLGYQPTLRITLKQGLTLEGTPEHPIVVMTEEGQLQFRRLSELKPGDSVAIKYNTQAFGYLQEVDVDQAYLMGLLTGDGNLTGSNRVRFTNVDEELVQFFRDHIRRRYGANVQVRVATDQITHEVCSWRVKNDLLRCGMTCALSGEKSIPPQILQAPKEIIVAFLQGLLDADGSFERYSVQYCTASKKLMQQVIALLLNLGVVPRLRIKTVSMKAQKRDYYEIAISGTFLGEFARQVGFRLLRKQQKLLSYLDNAAVGVNTNVDVIHHLTDTVLNCWYDLRQRGGSTSRQATQIDKLRARQRISRNTLKELVKAFARGGCSGEKHDYLNRLSEADMFFSPVQRIDPGMARVYDFTVPETHSFISNGFISHNTLLAKAVAGEADVAFFSMSGSDFVELFVGVGASRVRDLFSQAEGQAPCIIFIDELDALGKTRGGLSVGGHDEREQTLNQLLVEMDGFDSDRGVIIMAATNRPETLDPALLRPGRFDRTVVVDRPDLQGREAILKVHTRDVKLSDDVDLRHVASLTPGTVGADLENIVNEAALLAARKNRKAVTMHDFNEAIERGAIGLERKSRIMTPDEKLRVAYHEGGHALVACALPNTSPVHKVTIVPRGVGALGYVLQRPEDDRHMKTRGELESEIKVCLGGTLAEELIYGEIANGATSDLRHANQIARVMVKMLGMSRLGRVFYQDEMGNPFLGGANPFETPREYSEETAREIDLEVRTIIERALEEVRQILLDRRDALEAIARRLMEKEVIDGKELRELLAAFSPGPKLVPASDAIVVPERLPDGEVKEVREVKAP